MAKIKSACVYCGSTMGVDPTFKASAEHLGRLMAEHDIKLVFGGGRVGIMGAISTACMEAGGHVTGVMTEFLNEYEGGHDGITELHVVESMHERKHMMFQLSDAFIIFPGGLGTLDEAFEIMTWKQVGLHAKQVVFVNIKDYWTPLLEGGLEKMISENFVREEDRKLFKIANTIEDVIPAINEKPHLAEGFVSKWG